jgi:hypothetical protein
MNRVRETTFRAREHQTTGKRVGTKNDTRSMGSHATTVAVPERRPTRRRQQKSGAVQS